MTVLLHIIERHADELASLWDLRQRLATAHHFSFRELWVMDRRLEANVEGLALAREEAWPICRQQLGLETAGDVFTHAIVAFHAGRMDWLTEVLEAAKDSPRAWRGLVGALGWIALPSVKPLLSFLLAASDPHQRRLGLAAAAAHRYDAGEPLRNALEDSASSVRAEALRAAGELGLGMLDPVLRSHAHDPDPQCRFWAAWSASILARNSEALQVLVDEIEAAGPLSEEAVGVVARRFSLDGAQRWLQRPDAAPPDLRVRLLAAGARGSPELVSWLIAHMDAPDTARLAGASFAAITGVVLDRDGLEGERPESVSAGPNEDPADENVEMDADGDLPWPSAQKVRAFWNAYAARFVSGERYLLGAPITAPGCMALLRSGRQEQRAAAAMELALLQASPLFPVTAPAFRQSALLASTSA